MSRSEIVFGGVYIHGGHLPTLGGKASGAACFDSGSRGSGIFQAFLLLFCERMDLAPMSERNTGDPNKVRGEGTTHTSTTKF